MYFRCFIEQTFYSDMCRLLRLDLFLKCIVCLKLVLFKQEDLVRVEIIIGIITRPVRKGNEIIDAFSMNCSGIWRWQRPFTRRFPVAHASGFPRGHVRWKRSAPLPTPNRFERDNSRETPCAHQSQTKYDISSHAGRTHVCFTSLRVFPWPNFFAGISTRHEKCVEMPSRPHRSMQHVKEWFTI